jgi:rod shape-determining protein MreD
MTQILKIAGIFLATMVVQIYVAHYMAIGAVRPDFVLVFLVFISARYGRTWGILAGFMAGLLQDATGSLSVLGANALAKSVVGYILGTLNGTLAVWTPRVVNLYIYGTLFGHAIIYQTIMAQGLETAPFILIGRIFLEAFISSVFVTALRLMIPLVPQPA